MKKRVVILVTNKEISEEELNIFQGIKKTIGKRWHLLRAISKNPHQILEDVLSIIRTYGVSDYNRILVLYTGGEGFHLLNDNLPCNKIDINLLLQSLIEVVGGKETPQQKYLICTMYAGAIHSLINS